MSRSGPIAECNRCTLTHIEHVQARGDAPREVTVRQTPIPGVDTDHLWVGVYVGDDPEPVAVFDHLTTHCVC